MSSVSGFLLQPSNRVLLPCDQNRPPKFQKQCPRLTFDTDIIDFGICFPGQTNKAPVVINIHGTKNTPLTLVVSCYCADQELDSLPQYVFGLAAPNSSLFLNQIRIKVQAETKVEFNIGMKIPGVEGYVAGIIVATVQGTQIQPLKMLIRATSILPLIICSKELFTKQNRSIRILIKNSKTANKKEDRRVMFRNLEEVGFTAETQVIGLQDDRLVDCSPRIVSVSPEGILALTIHIRATEKFNEAISSYQANYTVRRVLILKLKDSAIIIHFPLQIVFVYSKSCVLTLE